MTAALLDAATQTTLDPGPWLLIIAAVGGLITSVLTSAAVLLKLYLDAKEARGSRDRQEKAIQQNTDISVETNKVVATVQKQTNRGLGVALRGKAVADRALAIAMDRDPALMAVAAISEKAADEHDAQAKLADEDVSRRADAVAVASAENKKPWPLPTGPADPALEGKKP